MYTATVNIQSETYSSNLRISRSQCCRLRHVRTVHHSNVGGPCKAGAIDHSRHIAEYSSQRKDNLSVLSTAARNVDQIAKRDESLIEAPIAIRVGKFEGNVRARNSGTNKESRQRHNRERVVGTDNRENHGKDRRRCSFDKSGRQIVGEGFCNNKDRRDCSSTKL